MSAFNGHLDIRLMDEVSQGREVWMLLSPILYDSDLLGDRVVVPAGFVTDFESVPEKLSALTGPRARRAGLVHDFLYQAHRCRLERDALAVTKDQADRVYHEAMQCTGLDPVWCDQRFGAVCQYGKPSWETGPDRMRVLTV